MLRGIFSRINQRLSSLSIYYRIVIGNAIIIIVGAIGGTLITRHFAQEAAELGLILLFATIGIVITVIINGLIVRQALLPLRDLSLLVRKAKKDPAEIVQGRLRNPDPDILQLANSLNSLITQLKERNRQLRALSERVINAQEEERKRIARNLHDDTGQALTRLIMQFEQITNQFSNDESEIISKLEETSQLASQTLRELRQIIAGLRPTILDDLGLIPALRWYARTHLEPEGVKVILKMPDEPPSLSPERTTALFRIAQEAINNVLRHAQADSVKLTLEQKQGKICLEICDDGRGFIIREDSGRSFGSHQLGLLGIQERAELVGGNLEIHSAEGKGTTLNVCVPVAQ